MNTLIQDCINNKLSRTPIWLMRQAGRYLPEFRSIREKNQNFVDLCFKPDLVKEITLQPIKRFNLDATIIFSDILMVPFGLGQFVEFKKGYGPKLKKFNSDNLLGIEKENFTKKLSPIYDAIKRVK